MCFLHRLNGLSLESHLLGALWRDMTPLLLLVVVLLLLLLLLLLVVLLLVVVVLLLVVVVVVGWLVARRPPKCADQPSRGCSPRQIGMPSTLVLSE